MKNLKPIEIDAHLKYVCPKCGINHWVSLKEASTPKFLIVCDCNLAFSIKKVKKLKVIFSILKKKQTQYTNTENVAKENKQIPKDLLGKSIIILETFGFTKKEAEELLVKSYLKNPIENCADLVKYSLSLIGANNV